MNFWIFSSELIFRLKILGHLIWLAGGMVKAAVPYLILNAIVCV